MAAVIHYTMDTKYYKWAYRMALQLIALLNISNESIEWFNDILVVLIN